MRKLETAMALGLLLSIFTGSMSEFSNKLDTLQENVLRLHILANSDSEQDQNLKLQVRDALLAESENLFQDCETLADMEQQVLANQEEIQAIAEQVLRENGCDDKVIVELAEMQFDTRVYETITMPAGEYEALRILIGNAEGHNWWCVMYPPLCLPVAEPEMYFDTETTKILETPEQYEIRFKCIEIWNELINKKAL